MKLKFLGTGGGRYVTGFQRRQTAGILLETDETTLHIDPGPGALVKTHEEHDPEEVEAIIVSHAHLDHCNDAEATIEMMTEAYDKPGTVFANETALKGYGDIDRAISSYHQDLCAKVKELGEDNEYSFKDVTVESQQMFHTDPKTAGFKIATEDKDIGFWTDTQFSEELIDFYEGCDTLVVYCARPRNESLRNHTSLDEVPKLVNETEPKTVIITHFGYKFLDSDLEEQEEWLDEQVEAKVVFAEDGMEFPGNRTLGDF